MRKGPIDNPDSASAWASHRKGLHGRGWRTSLTREQDDGCRAAGSVGQEEEIVVCEGGRRVCRRNEVAGEGEREHGGRSAPGWRRGWNTSSGAQSRERSPQNLPTV